MLAQGVNQQTINKLKSNTRHLNKHPIKQGTHLNQQQYIKKRKNIN